MTKHLAQMTEAQREECIGMWVKTPKGYGVLVDHMSDAGYYEPMVIVPSRFAVHDGTWDWGQLELLPHLPRAWTPDGRPVPGEWAEGHMWWGEDTDTMQTVDLVGAECLTTGEIQGLEEWPEGVTPGEDVPVRRFISKWEPIP